MPSPDQLEAFVAAAEQGSFSAAARRLGKVQSAVSNAISNLEIETNLELFDRSSRNSVLTESGKAMLRLARNALQSQQDFLDRATALSNEVETQLCLALEQSVACQPLLPLLREFEQHFPHIELELLDPGSSDVAALISSNRADIGLMMAEEQYPMDFNFHGMGHSRLLPVCHKAHPLVTRQPVSHAELRSHRQLLCRSRSRDFTSHERFCISADIWLSESPYIVMELLCAGIGWAFLHQTVVQEKIDSGELVALQLDSQAPVILNPVDLVWAKDRNLGTAGQWLLQRMLKLDLYQPR